MGKHRPQLVKSPTSSIKIPQVKKKYWGGFFPEYELRRRETGFGCQLGWEGIMKHKLYSSLYPCKTWDPMFSCYADSGSHHGGIFNLEFSPDGKKLVAACEKNALMVFDPLTRKQLYDVSEAHENCVNGIKFLDNRMFATCSDDKTVALWDVRNLKRKIRSLLGHDNWVKNIEYSWEENLLVTSGFDGRILAWNINSFNNENSNFVELFKMKGLMRIKITPDSKKLIICTTGGYMLLINDLDLENLSEDLLGFKPYVYRLMQMSRRPMVQPFDFTKLFQRKRNRIEFISDFPTGNYPEIIHSLQVHPQGWSALSRNTSVGGASEWTCVHDIQDLETKNELEYESEDEENFVGEESGIPRSSFLIDSSQNLQLALSSSRLEVLLEQRAASEALERDDDENNNNNDRFRTDESTENLSLSNNSSAREVFDLRVRFRTTIDVLNTFRQMEFIRMEEERNINNPDEATPPIPISDIMNNNNTAENGTSSTSRRNFRLRRRRLMENVQNSDEREDYRNVFFIRSGLHPNRPSMFVGTPDDLPPGIYRKEKIVKNAPRLTNYMEEPNKGKGFIKELCFSSDGRLICSPYDCGVRLMMFDEKCSELSRCIQKTPQSLCVVSSNISHKNCVVSTKFSPVDYILVSGCLNGKIVWHQPVL